jgi:hypothetical protein
MGPLALNLCPLPLDSVVCEEVAVHVHPVRCPVPKLPTKQYHFVLVLRASHKSRFYQYDNLVADIGIRIGQELQMQEYQQEITSDAAISPIRTTNHTVCTHRSTRSRKQAIIGR